MYILGVYWNKNTLTHVVYLLKAGNTDIEEERTLRVTAVYLFERV